MRRGRRWRRGRRSRRRRRRGTRRRIGACTSILCMKSRKCFSLPPFLPPFLLLYYIHFLIYFIITFTTKIVGNFNILHSINDIITI
jgi:hypothetical protein